MEKYLWKINQGKQRLSADTIISAFGMKSRNELAKEIADKYPRAKIRETVIMLPR